MASTGILITNFGSIISGDMNRLRTSEVRNPFHCVLTLYLCNNARLRTTGAWPALYQVRFQSNCLIFHKKMRKDIHKTGEPRHATMSGIGRPIMKA
ncbi:MAG: hypothetical protein E5299_00419 [Burkholderia gladioli]|nr:MAG: hypothetical protein E5299_00419 [Burkholderia gladioli]